jgi:SAM-dependent methyltransferase
MVDLIRRLFGAAPSAEPATAPSPAEDRGDLEHAYRIIMRHLFAPPLEVDTHVDPATLERLQKRVETTWSALGQADAHWSVITDTRFQKATLEDHLDLFFEMGEGDIARVAAAMARVGACLEDIGSVIDFGCGVGRLSVPLARRTGHVTGVDISAAHLAEARGNVDVLELGNVALRQISSVREIADLPRVDLVLSIIVLQHNPPPVMREILAALCDRVAPGGYLYLQTPTYRDGYRYRASEDRDDVAEGMEMHLLPQHVFFATIQDAGLTILEVTEDAAAYDLSFRSQVVLCRRRPASTCTPGKPGQKRRRASGNG